MSSLTNQYLEELEIAKQDIKTALEEKGVSPTGGYTSYAEAIDDIYVPKIQEYVTKDIDTNGSYAINADSGYDAIGGVTVNVNVPPYEPEYDTLVLTIEENGSHWYYPHTGFPKWDKAHIITRVEPKVQDKTMTITRNGVSSVFPDTGYDGLSSVEITVDVASSGGGGGESKPQVLNGFRFTGGDLAQVDFGAYDWSMVYDTYYFFQGCTHSTGDWTNFNENFNGKFVDGSYAFYNLNMTSMPNIDTSHLVSATQMFYNCTSLESVPDLDLSNIKNWGGYGTSQGCEAMFYNCTSLKTVGKLITPTVRSIKSMFYGCPITSIPDMDFDNVLNMESSFQKTKVAGDYNLNLPKCVQFVSAFREINGAEALNMNIKFEEDPNAQIFKDASRTGVSVEHSFTKCTNLKSLNITGRIAGLVNICSNSGVETFRCDSDLSHITACYQTFTNCTNLKSISDLNLSSVKDFYNSNPSVYGWVYGCRSLESMGVIDCDSVTDIGHIVPYNYGYALVNLGGFRNLGKASSVASTNGNYFLNAVPNLTYESVMNVLNLLYDRTSAGLSVLTLKLHPNHLAMLSEDDIAVATNKGWTLV